MQVQSPCVPVVLLDHENPVQKSELDMMFIITSQPVGSSIV